MAQTTPADKAAALLSSCDALRAYVTGDAKGVVLRRPADAPPIRSHDHQRSPKSGRKKQAIVGAI